MKFTIGLLASLACFSSSAGAATKVSVAGVTSTQAVLRVTTDQAGSCTYQLSELQNLSVPVKDVDPVLFPGSNSDARATAVLTGSERFFVAGLRRGDQGSDGKFYSRALAANTAHYGAVSCGADAPVPFTFTTHSIAVGNVYVDPLPFDSRGLGNYSIPSFDFTDLTKWYVDPQTGFKFKLATGPGQMLESVVVLTGNTSTVSGAGGGGSVQGEVLSGTNWASPANGFLNGSFATYTASAQDVLMLRMASTCYQGQCYSFGWQNVNGTGSGMQTANMDAFQVAFSANGAGSSQTVDIALSFNGVNQATDWYPQTVPATTGAITYPAALMPGFAAWQNAAFPLIPAVGINFLEEHASVTTSGTGVSWNGGAYFPLDARLLTAGSKMTINGAEYTIASVDSGTHVTLTTSAGSQNATAFWSNFTVMVRKHTASAGTINIGNMTVTAATSESFGNGGSGFQNHCSHQTSTDSAGNVGRFCLFQSHWGHSGIYWVTDSGDSRFVGRGALRPSSLGVPQDEYGFSFYNGQSLFDTNDPNSWFATATLNQSGHSTLIKLTYHPEGVGGCSMPGGYGAISPAANYDPNSIDNCNIVATEITRPSLGKDLSTQISAINPIAASAKFGNAALSFVQNGYAVLTNGPQQDAEAWITTVNISTGNVLGVFSTYMNRPHGSCRGCVLHGTGPSSPMDNWFFLIFNSYFGGPFTGLGPYRLSINTPLTTTPSISVSACQALITDPAVSWLVQYSDGCDMVTFAGSDGVPCDPDPSALESTNMPGCSWHSGWTQWQAGALQPGDWFQDPATGFEQGVIGAKSGNTLTIIRDVNPPKGPPMQVQPQINIFDLRAHAAGWMMQVICSYSGNAFVNATAETDGSGMLWDRKFFSFNHSVFRSAGIISSESYNWAQGASGQSVRQGSYPTAQNLPETNAVFNGALFSGAKGVGGSGGYLQAHPGWSGSLSFYTDMAPFAPGQGGSFSLWPITATNVSGTLYKISSPNMVLPMNKRKLGTGVWSGMYNFQDISGIASIGGTAADKFHWCSIDYVGATCGQTGENVGDVFMNIPQATLSGSAGQTYDLNAPNAAPLGMEPMAALQYFYYHLPPADPNGNGENLGRWERRVTTGFGRYEGQDTYSNSKVIINSNLLVFNCGTPNLQRIGDLCIGQAPAETQDSVARNDFVRYPVQIPAGGAAFAEVQFGYAENGAPGQFYCTTRQEACNTSSPTGTVFNWEHESRTLTNCASGCKIQVPIIPGRVVYYSIRRSADGVTWSNGPLQVISVN